MRWTWDKTSGHWFLFCRRCSLDGSKERRSGRHRVLANYATGSDDSVADEAVVFQLPIRRTTAAVGTTLIYRIPRSAMSSTKNISIHREKRFDVFVVTKAAKAVSGSRTMWCIQHFVFKQRRVCSSLQTKVQNQGANQVLTRLGTKFIEPCQRRVINWFVLLLASTDANFNFIVHNNWSFKSFPWNWYGNNVARTKLKLL